METPEATSFVRVRLFRAGRGELAEKGAIKGPLTAPRLPRCASRANSKRDAPRQQLARRRRAARMGCCGSRTSDVAPRDDDPERETSAFTPQKLKLLRETLSPPRPEKRGSACGRACKALFLITLVATAAFSGAAAAGSFDSFCLGAAPLPKRGSSRAPMVESRAEAAVGLQSGEAFCSAVDVGRTAVGIGRKGLGYLPPLPAFITRRVPAPVRTLWDWVAGGEEPAAPAKAAPPPRPKPEAKPPAAKPAKPAAKPGAKKPQKPRRTSKPAASSAEFLRNAARSSKPKESS